METQWFRLNPDVVWIDEPDEVRAYLPWNSEFISINESGASIWRSLAKTESFDDLLGVLALEYQAETPDDLRTLAEDARHFIAELIAERVLIPGDSKCVDQRESDA